MRYLTSDYSCSKCFPKPVPPSLSRCIGSSCTFFFHTFMHITLPHMDAYSKTVTLLELDVCFCDLSIIIFYFYSFFCFQR